MSLQVEILKPEGNEALRKLAVRKLISIRPDPVDGFEALLKIIRQRVRKSPIKRAEINKEVESVRTKRYAGKKK